MDFVMAVKLSIKSILSNKMRTFLTMLGIIIGVAAVIILVSIAQGTTKSVTENIESMGSNLLTVNITGRGTKTSITYDETLELNEKEGVKEIAPVINGKATAKNGLKSMDVNLEGVNETYLTVRNYELNSGRFILPLDIDYNQKVVVLGSEVVKEVFGILNPIGEEILLDGNKFKVVGVLEEKGSSFGGSNDEKVLMPITTAERFLKTKGVKSIYIQAESKDTVSVVSNQMESYLNKQFNNDEDAYKVFNQEEMLSTVNEVTASMTIMLGGIAAISLLVGGIGIMNIMLVSVTERTREIGIRKAIGAKRRDILTQFLIEAIVISGVGGILGIMFGLFGNYMFEKFTSSNVSVSLMVLAISFSFALVVGVSFGIFPANKASKLKPVDALRYE